MKTLLWLFLICLIVFGVGLGMHKDSGYVLITYQHWSIETTLWTLLFSILILFCIIYCLISLIRSSIYFTKHLYTWSSRRRQRKIQRDLHQGVYALIEGHWARAESYFTKSIAYNSQPLTSYMGAAIAAQKQNVSLRRENYLKTAYELNPEAEITLGFLQAQLQIEAEDWINASTTLEKLRKLTGSHPYLQVLSEKIPAIDR